MILSFFLILPSSSPDGAPGIQVQTQHTATQSAILTGRSADPHQLTAGEILNLNRATQAELERLPGIGAVKAQAILDYRAAHGSFQTIDELTAVTGIGEATLKAIRPYLTLE